MKMRSRLFCRLVAAATALSLTVILGAWSGATSPPAAASSVPPSSTSAARSSAATRSSAADPATAVAPARVGRSASAPAAPAPPPGPDPRLGEARAAFLRGIALAEDMRWAEALGQFEQAAALRPHPATTHNIGVCLRALGFYTRAHRAFVRAMVEDQRPGGEALTAGMRDDLRAYLDEIGRVLAVLDVTLEPVAAVSVDGRPLERREDPGEVPTLVAGTLPPGSGQIPPGPRFRLLLDPGTHVFVLTRPGFAEAIHRQSVRPGSRATLRLALEQLPASLTVTSTPERAAIAVDGIDVGTAPLTISRPAGRYQVTVRKRDFVSQEREAVLRAGEQVTVVADLRPRPQSVFKRWWFWTAAAVVVTGVALGTYFGTRPDPVRPPLNGGGLGWTIRVP
jgi:hypothetical protein